MSTASPRETKSTESFRSSAGQSRATTALEGRFPFEKLNLLAELESWRKEINRPVYHVHKWWANRLGSVFRAIVLGANLDQNADLWAEFYKEHDFGDRIILDPFMGSGTTIGEALKLGCKAIGCDINPVAYFQVRKALEYCDPHALWKAYRRLEESVAPAIRAVYQSSLNGERADILYTFWVKILPCPDCGAATRLFSTWIFASNAYPSEKPDSWALCPQCGELQIVHYSAQSVTCQSCQLRYNPQTGPAGRNEFTCEKCGHVHPILDVVRSLGQPPKHDMYALKLLLPDGRKVYKRADAHDWAIYNRAAAELKRRALPIPDTEIPPGYNTDQARAYNYRYWREMFNERQQYALGTLLQGILNEADQNARENLLLLFSGILEFNSLFCSFKGEGTGAVRHVFYHHILKPERTPLEANPWGTDRSSGSFSTLFKRRLLAAKKYCAQPFELRATVQGGRIKGAKVFGLSKPIRPRLAREFGELVRGEADALLLHGDSSKLPLPDGCVDAVVTDPPYFDNVHYSELADYFYSWLRLGMRGRDSAFDAQTTRSAREVQGVSAKEFGALLGDVLVESARVLKPSGVLAFTFHHSRGEAWAALADAIEKAGLEVVATHPVKAEMSVATPKNQAKEPINLDLIIVCKRPSAQPGLSREAIVQETLTEAGDLIRRYNAAGTKLSRGDVRVILMGAFLKAHSRWLWSGAGTKNGAQELIAQFSSQIESLFEGQIVAPRPAPPSDQPTLFAEAENRA